MRTRFLSCALLAWLAAACSGGADETTTGGAGASSGSSSGGASGTTGVGGGAGSTANQGGNGGSHTGGAGGTTAMGDSGAPVRMDAGGDGARDAARDAAITDGPAVGSTLKYPPAFTKGDLAAGLAQLNLYRVALGESIITLDEASTTGCVGHVNYLVAEESMTNMVTLTHDEKDHANPYYSVDNEKAGLQSDIAYGTGSSGDQTFGQAIDLWINGLYHRRPLLDPGLTKVGAASKSGFNCINYGATGNTVVLKLDGPTIWPPDGMIDVPRTFSGNEGPCPTNPTNPLAVGDCGKGGYIPNVTFYNWGTARKSAIESVSIATITDDAAQTVVPLLAYYADAQAGHDPAPGYVADEIALVPQASLAANKTYRVDISAVVKGAATKLSWKFTTGTRTE